MRKIAIIVFLASFYATTAVCQLKPEDQELVMRFINLVKNGDRKGLAKIVSYPLSREYPLPAIKNQQEFLSRYDELFDEALKKMIISSKPGSDWDKVGWRGITLRNGEIWLDEDGKLIAINYQSRMEHLQMERLIALEKLTLHPLLQKFEKPVLILETSQYRVRIDDMGQGHFRYASWKLNKKMTDKPDLIVLNGELIFQGSGGNHTYQFKNNSYVYECYIEVMGAEGAPRAVLTILKGEQEILSQNARILTR